MTKGTKLFLTFAGLAVALVFALAVRILYFSEWPGGMRSSYAAADYDPRLTRVAATAKPLITALQRYHADHSAYPANEADFASYLSSPPADPTAPHSDSLLGWYYFQNKKSGGYVLSYKLGWDPSLGYHYDGSEARWVFHPGDGSPEKTIVLKP